MGVTNMYSVFHNTLAGEFESLVQTNPRCGNLDFREECLKVGKV
jgi:hypothetical protein